MKNNLNYSINELNLSNVIIDKLNKLNIFTVEQLWMCSRIFLKRNGLIDLEINQIQIKLQLRSLDLDKKIYKV